MHIRFRITYVGTANDPLRNLLILLIVFLQVNDFCMISGLFETGRSRGHYRPSYRHPRRLATVIPA